MAKVSERKDGYAAKSWLMVSLTDWAVTAFVVFTILIKIASIQYMFLILKL